MKTNVSRKERDTARILSGDNNEWEAWIRPAGVENFYYHKTFDSRKAARDWCEAADFQIDE